MVIAAVALAAGGGFHVDFDTVGVLNVLQQSPCRVQSCFARTTDVVAGFCNKEKEINKSNS